MRRKDREVNEEAGIRSILDKSTVCSVAMIDDGEVYIVPLSFGYHLSEGILTLYFHCAPKGRKLEVMKKNPKVGFEIHWEGTLLGEDEACRYTTEFASVIGTGTAALIDDFAQREVALKALMSHLTGRDFSFDERALKSVYTFKITATNFVGKHN